MHKVRVGDWVKVLFEGELFIGKVVAKASSACCVRCLKMPYQAGCNGTPFEREKDAVYYNSVYAVRNHPVLKKIGRQFL